MKRTIVIFVLIISFVSCSSSNEEKLTLPYKSNFSTSKEWNLGSDAIIDTKENAIKLSQPGKNWRTSDRAISEFQLPIKADKTYTISLKLKSGVWPPPSVEVSGIYYGNNGFIANSLGTLITSSKAGIWEESTVYIHVPNNQEIKSLKIKIVDMPKKSINGNIWIKDITFKEGFFTTKQKPSKKSFEGSVTKIDKLGNIEIFKNGKFEPFFPIGIHTDHKRADWSIYKNQGFNIAMWADGANAIQKAKNAGLYSSMQLVHYIIPVSDDWIPQEQNQKIAHLKATLKKIKTQGLTNDLLFYYIDNEFYHLKKKYTEVVDIAINQDYDQSGKRMHPIYMLSGTYGVARKYNKRVDFTGTYVAEDRYETDRTDAFVTLNDTQNQTQPTIIAQINRGVGLNFRPILFGAIARGARGMAFWRDGGKNVGDISNKSWWSELPKISKEIELMMPLIRADHKTSWSVSTNNDKVIFGTRTVNGLGYMILANPTRSEKIVTFTLENFSYNPSAIIDYFTHKKIGKVQGDKVTLSIEAQNSKVIKLIQ